MKCLDQITGMFLHSHLSRWQFSSPHPPYVAAPEGNPARIDRIGHTPAMHRGIAYLKILDNFLFREMKSISEF